MTLFEKWDGRIIGAIVDTLRTTTIQECRREALEALNAALEEVSREYDAQCYRDMRKILRRHFGEEVGN